MISFLLLLVGASAPEMVALQPTHPLEVREYTGHARPKVSSAIPKEYRRIVEKAAHENGIPIRVLSKLIASESSWREWLIAGPNADGSYDYGIAGFNSRYIGWFRATLGEFNPFVAAEAIPVAARWLKALHDGFGNWEEAVTAYKCGARRTATGRAPLWVVVLAREVAR